MDDLEQMDALTDEQRERVSRALMNAMAQMACMTEAQIEQMRAFLPELVEFARQLADVADSLALAVTEEHGNEPSHIYPGRVGDGRALRAPKHAGLRDNRR